MNGMDSQGLWVVELPGGIYTWNAGAQVTVTGTMRLESSDGEPVMIDGDGKSLQRFAEVDGGRLEVGDGVVFRNFEICMSSCSPSDCCSPRSTGCVCMMDLAARLPHRTLART